MTKADVWTNVFYGASGVLVWIGATDPVHHYVAATFILLMVGSSAFHAKWHPFGQAMDECAMYISFSAILASHMPHPFLGILAAFGGWALAAAWVRVDSFVAMPFLAIMSLIAVAAGGAPWTALALLVALLASVAVRHIGEKKHSAALHGLWHASTAAIMYFMVFPQ